jgi:hypothetical protein
MIRREESAKLDQRSNSGRSNYEKQAAGGKPALGENGFRPFLWAAPEERIAPKGWWPINLGEQGMARARTLSKVF